MKGGFGFSRDLLAIVLGLAFNPPNQPGGRRKQKVPTNSGPVIDTTRESKRAKRRRLARSTA